ncbi:MAG: TonB-dependent receptor [Bacteroidales bacterium]
MPLSEISKPYMYATDKNGNPWSPGWYTLNLRTSIELPWSVTINAAIENILDCRYRPYSSGIVAPGRSLVVSLRYHLLK